MASQWSVMARLAGEEGLTQMELGRRPLFDRPATTGSLARVEARGLIGPRRSETGTRARAICFTVAARAVPQAPVPRGAVNATACRHLSQTEQRQRVALLNKVAGSFLRDRAVTQPRQCSSRIGGAWARQGPCRQAEERCGGKQGSAVEGGGGTPAIPQQAGEHARSQHGDAAGQVEESIGRAPQACGRRVGHHPGEQLLGRAEVDTPERHEHTRSMSQRSSRLSAWHRRATIGARCPLPWS
jgi:DNA-binding MarR family transcriptional regulator